MARLELIILQNLFFWEFPPKITYYSHNFILLFSQIILIIRNRMYTKKKRCSMHKVNSKGNFKCSQYLLVKVVAAEEGLPLDTARDSLGNTFTLTAACEAPVPENKTFSFYPRLFSHYSRTEKSLLFPKLCRHIRLKPSDGHGGVYHWV